MHPINFLTILVAFTAATTALYIENPAAVERTHESAQLNESAEEWTVIQRREPQTGLQIDFYLTWNEYVTGFGLNNGSHWLGLETIHQLTKNHDQELQIILTDLNDTQRIANYKRFWISDATDEYRLFVADFSGNAGDSFSTHSGMQFSTKDNENGIYPGNCAELSRGAWWYKYCYDSNLNGVYYDESVPTSKDGIHWTFWRGNNNLKHVEMKIRSKSKNTE